MSRRRHVPRGATDLAPGCMSLNRRTGAAGVRLERDDGYELLVPGRGQTPYAYLKECWARTREERR
jgi:hypothetical protein